MHTYTHTATYDMSIIAKKTIGVFTRWLVVLVQTQNSLVEDHKEDTWSCSLDSQSDVHRVVARVVLQQHTAELDKFWIAGRQHIQKL